jgi:1,2-diacylglycerol 3-beta-galactosyltransferase
MRLPVIVESNVWTMAHERYNADWIRERELGIVLSSFAKISEGVREILRPERFRRFRQNAAAIRNTAVFEIPDLLNTILARQAA